MNKKQTDNWVIFGTSPFITEMHREIPRLCSEYQTIGLNLFPTGFQDVDYWIFNDSEIFQNCYKKGYFKKHHKLIVGKNSVSEMKTKYFRKTQCVIKKDFIIKPHFIFEPQTTIALPISDQTSCHYEKNGIRYGRLLFIFSVVLPAINYAMLNGAKNIILAGIDLSPNWKRFYSSSNQKPNWQINVIKEKIELFKPHVNIYKANKNANIDCKSIDIKNL